MREVKRFRYQFWPDMPWMTSLETRDIRLKCDAGISFTSGLVITNARARDNSRVVAFAAPSPAKIPTFSSEFDFTHEQAAAAIRYVKRGGPEYIDLYFDMVRNGVSDKEYAKWIKDDFGLTPTTGRYILTWDPSKVEIPKAVELLAQSKEQFEKYQREKRFLDKNVVTLDSFGAKWVHDKKK